MKKSHSKKLEEVTLYYQDKVNQYGATPKGVDWNGEDSQFLRFDQLLKVIDQKTPDKFSIADLGCGYGALHKYLEALFPNHIYHGYDISEKMLDEAEKHISNNAMLHNSGFLTEHCDYAIASGIFNVRLDSNESDWLNYILTILDNLNTYSKKGFSFNCLTSYSDKDKMQNYLYYACPNFIFDHCKSNYSRKVALLHDYDLYEFTIIVRKT